MSARGGIIPDPIARQPWEMLIPLFLLVGFGAAVLFSAAGGSMQPFAASHLIRFGVFLVMAAVIASLPRELVRLLTYPAYVAVLLLLIAVEVIGQVGGGSQRWLDLGFMVLQPSELMKPVIVVTLALFYSTLPVGLITSWRALLVPGAMIGRHKATRRKSIQHVPHVANNGSRNVGNGMPRFQNRVLKLEARSVGQNHGPQSIVGMAPNAPLNRCVDVFFLAILACGRQVFGSLSLIIISSLLLSG